MTIRREALVRRRLETLLEELAAHLVPPRVAPDRGIGREDALACLEAAYQSRLIDLKARELKNQGLGFYTIGSSGHESNAVLGRLLRPDDPCLLHYRSGALMAARLRRAPGQTFLWDTLLSLVASREDPVSGGRHKVWGSRRLWVPPQTSTIASHLPKAVGMAFSLGRASHLGLEDGLPDDAIVMASFGDASVNHASATTAINAACWAAHQLIPMPILFVCEDNGVGISVRTPRSWIASAIGGRHEMDFYEAEGSDLEQCWAAAREAIAHCRRTRRPTFLWLHVVRLLGHAGSDIESQYLDERSIEVAETRDPLLAMSRFVVERGFASGAELRTVYDEIAERIERAAARAVARPKLTTAAEIVEPLRFPAWVDLRAEAQRVPTPERRAQVFGDGERLPERDRPRHLAMQLSRALCDLMLIYREMLVFGEDVAKKGGVYNVTAGLYERFGVGRVFNTLLDETTVLGIAIGAAQLGLLPVPEIQYLAYLHNAEDQLRGEACSQRFFSRGQWDNPMVVRIASFAYQKGFGGHFHNDNSVGVLRDIPGLIIAAPSRADDAVGMLRTCVAAAKVGRMVSAFLEPIALYMTRDLHAPGDGEWAFSYPPPGHAVPLGEPRVYGPESAGRSRVLLATFGNGVPIALRARRALGEAAVTVLDLRWLAPLPQREFLEHAKQAEAVLVLDECRRSGGGPSEALLAALAEDADTRGKPARRVTAHDSYVPLGGAAHAVLPGEEQVLEALRELLDGLEGR